MITRHNVLEMISKENLILEIITELLQYALTQKELEYIHTNCLNVFKSLACEALSVKYERACNEFSNDYRTLSRLHADLCNRPELRYQLQAFNISYDLAERARTFALYSEFHEVMKIS